MKCQSTAHPNYFGRMWTLLSFCRMHRLPGIFLIFVVTGIDLTVTRSVFFTTFVQYNSQYKSMNINTRLQWRFKPVSDLFIVYTDNYFYSFDQQPVENFSPKNRAIVVKLTYWFNL